MVAVSCLGNLEVGWLYDDKVGIVLGAIITSRNVGC